MSLINDLSSAFERKIHSIELPDTAIEWGWPMKVWHLPMTMKTRERVQKFVASDNLSEAYLRVVCMTLCDEDGKRRFDDGDKFLLAKKTPGWIVTLLGDAIIQSQSSYEAEEKND